jgi:hypothetical protein
MSLSDSDELSLRFAVTYFQADAITEALRALHCKCYMHKRNSLGYMLGGSNKGAVTAAGSASQLSQAALAVLNPTAAQRTAATASVQQTADMRCALRIANISTDMACKLMILLPTVTAAAASGKTQRQL